MAILTQQPVLNLAAVAAALDRVSDQVKAEILSRGASAATATQSRAIRTYPNPYTRRSKAGGQDGRSRQWITTGTLQRSVSRQTSPALAKVTAPHVHLFEEGTRVRRTASGAHRGAVVGLYRQNPTRTFIGIAVAERAAMFTAIQHLLDRDVEL